MSDVDWAIVDADTRESRWVAVDLCVDVNGGGNANGNGVVVESTGVVKRSVA